MTLVSAPVLLSAVAVFLNLLTGALPFHLVFDHGMILNMKQLSHEPVVRMRTSLFAETMDSNFSYDPSVIPEIKEFAYEVQCACHTGTFVSFAMLGPSQNPPRNQEKEEWKNQVRGRIRSVHGRIIQLKSTKKKKQKMVPQENTDLSQWENKGDLYLQVTLKYHGKTDIAQNWKISNNQVDEELLQLIEREFTIDSKAPLAIQRGELITTEGSWVLSKRFSSDPSTYQLKVLHSKPTAKNVTKPVLKVAPHDRPKNTPLSPHSPFFIKLGVTNAEGKPRPGMESKLRQCQHFVDTLYGLIEETIDKNVTELTTVDMGCGKGYLTFALHAHLSDKYYNRINSYGVEMRAELVQEINVIAHELGSPFESLRFFQGSIGHFQLRDEIDVLIALHACDTATDDAIFFGIKHQAKVIVTAPCCHKEIRSQLDSYFSSHKESHPYKDILRYPIYRERVAESVTDSMRALLLEIAGYNVKVFEFIGGEHTSKNVIITATKLSHTRPPSQLESMHDRLISLAQMHGIYKQKLAFLLTKKLKKSTDDESDQRKTRQASRLPPL
jgi:hypothetical protein